MAQQRPLPEFISFDVLVSWADPVPGIPYRRSYETITLGAMDAAAARDCVTALNAPRLLDFRIEKIFMTVPADQKGGLSA